MAKTAVQAYYLAIEDGEETSMGDLRDPREYMAALENLVPNVQAVPNVQIVRGVQSRLGKVRHTPG